VYVWTAVGITKSRRKFYFYSLSRNKDSETMFRFNLELPKVEKYYTDGHFGYESMYGKKASQKKSRFTNIVENLNSQMRDKISYLVRRSKAHARSFEWLDNRLATFLCRVI
jgi:IS1 family transposase